MKHSIKVGIVGCGAIAKSHVTGYHQNAIYPVGFADASLDRAVELSKHSNGAKAYSAYRDLLDSGVDAISICTPPNIHREIAVEALKRGIHVLCEKPLAASLEDCLAIEEAGYGATAKLMMAFRHRFLPAHKKIQELIDGGDFGRPVLFQNLFGGPMPEMQGKWFTQRAVAGGGVLMDTSVHGIDLFRFYCGEVVAASGQTHRAFEGTDVEDTGALVLLAKEGAIGLIAASWNIGSWNALVKIHTEAGLLVFDYNKEDEIQVKRGHGSEMERIEVKPSNGFSEQIACFLQSIESGAAPSPSAIDGRKVAEVLEGIYADR